MDLAVDQECHRSRWVLASGLGFGIQPVSNIAQHAELLANRRCGRIVAERGQLEAVYGRWWPYIGSLLQTWIDKRFRLVTSDRCELYYHAPLTSSKFLTLSYVRSGPKTSLSTFYASTLVLDEIARLRRANAIVCNVTNVRITDRLMQRWGWEEHCQDWAGRHFIKRLYGEYQTIKPFWRQRLRMGSEDKLHNRLPQL